MFDLEDSIQQWKRSFCTDTPIRTEELLEMESHLRDLISDLIAKGLSEREAMAVAASRLGAAEELQVEFAKNHPLSAWRTRLTWMLGGYIAVMGCGKTVEALVAMTSAAMAYARFESTAAAIAAVSIQSLAWLGILAIGYRVLVQYGDAHSHFSRYRAVLAGLGLLVLTCISAGARFAQFRWADAVWFGTSAKWLSCSGLAIHTCIYIVILVAMCRLSQPASVTRE
ncbi:MAG: permease prefix domain 1-containing protein [Planctomycetota bacterium]